MSEELIDSINNLAIDTVSAISDSNDLPLPNPEEITNIVSSVLTNMTSNLDSVLGTASSSTPVVINTIPEAPKYKLEDLLSSLENDPEQDMKLLLLNAYHIIEKLETIIAWQKDNLYAAPKSNPGDFMRAMFLKMAPLITNSEVQNVFSSIAPGSLLTVPITINPETNPEPDDDVHIL